MLKPLSTTAAAMIPAAAMDDVFLLIPTYSPFPVTIQYLHSYEQNPFQIGCADGIFAFMPILYYGQRSKCADLLNSYLSLFKHLRSYERSVPCSRLCPCCHGIFTRIFCRLGFVDIDSESRLVVCVYISFPVFRHSREHIEQSAVRSL